MAGGPHRPPSACLVLLRLPNVSRERRLQGGRHAHHRWDIREPRALQSPQQEDSALEKQTEIAQLLSVCRWVQSVYA